MHQTKAAPALRATPLLTRWMPGPVDPHDRPVVVSVTEYIAHRRRDVPGVAWRGWRMRWGWYAMPGAVGLWLWSLPARFAGGSISVWATEDDLASFVQLPHHVDIMSRYGARGAVRSTSWQAEVFQIDPIVRRAADWIGGGTA